MVRHLRLKSLTNYEIKISTEKGGDFYYKDICVDKKDSTNKSCCNQYSYEYNEEEGTFHVSVTLGKEKKNFKIPYRGGEIEIAETLAGKAIFAKFSKK